MPSPRVPALALASALVGALLVGCGGSSGPTKAAYIQKADAICARGDTQIQSVPKPQLTGGSAQIIKSLGDYVDKVLPYAQNVVTQLQALQRPAADQAVLKRYFTSLQDAVGKLRTLAAAARSGNAAAVQAGAKALSSTQPDTLARQYGFKRCGGTGGSSG